MSFSALVFDVLAILIITLLLILLPAFYAVRRGRVKTFLDFIIDTAVVPFALVVGFSATLTYIGMRFSGKPSDFETLISVLDGVTGNVLSAFAIGLPVAQALIGSTILLQESKVGQSLSVNAKIRISFVVTTTIWFLAYAFSTPIRNAPSESFRLSSQVSGMAETLRTIQNNKFIADALTIIVPLGWVLSVSNALIAWLERAHRVKMNE